MRGGKTHVEALMDRDDEQKSDLGNDKILKNAEGNNITGVKTSDLRRVDDKPPTPDPRALDPKNQDPRSQDPRTQDPLKQDPKHQDPTKHDPIHDTIKDDPTRHDRSKTASGGSKE
jgi:hypothetical protein